MKTGAGYTYATSADHAHMETCRRDAVDPPQLGRGGVRREGVRACGQDSAEDGRLKRVRDARESVHASVQQFPGTHIEPMAYNVNGDAAR